MAVVCTEKRRRWDKDEQRMSRTKWVVQEKSHMRRKEMGTSLCTFRTPIYTRAILLPLSKGSAKREGSAGGKWNEGARNRRDERGGEGESRRRSSSENSLTHLHGGPILHFGYK
jgi:hypothetical protein